jgi:peptidoglycan/xylan/chitin deacetylase (PgdA/CDA1 family)
MPKRVEELLNELTYEEAARVAAEEVRRANINKRHPWLKVVGILVLVAGLVAGIIYGSMYLRNEKPDIQIGQDLTGFRLGQIMSWEPRIAVSYPITQNEDVNDIINGFISGWVEEFRDKSDSLGELNVVFDVYRYDREVMGFRFVVYEAPLSAADGSETIVPMMFNMGSGHMYALSDLWAVPESEYLQVLSERSREVLLSMPGYESAPMRDAVMEKTAPVARNFERFVFDSEKLTIYITPHETGGTRRVEIRLRELVGLNTQVFSGGFIGEEREEIRVPVITLPSVEDPEDLTGKPLVALTFDDGPSSVTTPRLLDVLRDKGVKATFFVLGSRASYYPDIIIRQANEGHQVASHTMNHRDLSRLSLNGVMHEVNAANGVIESILGYGPTVMRPPYGAMNTRVREAGMPIILWSVDPQDWKNRDAGVIYNSVVSTVFDGSIILLHDIHGATIDAIGNIIDTLHAWGYVFVTIDELVEARGVTLQPGWSYRRF